MPPAVTLHSHKSMAMSTALSTCSSQQWAKGKHQHGDTPTMLCTAPMQAKLVMSPTFELSSYSRRQFFFMGCQRHVFSSMWKEPTQSKRLSQQVLGNYRWGNEADSSDTVIRKTFNHRYPEDKYDIKKMPLQCYHLWCEMTVRLSVGVKQIAILNQFVF